MGRYKAPSEELRELNQAMRALEFSSPSRVFIPSLNTSAALNNSAATAAHNLTTNTQQGMRRTSLNMTSASTHVTTTHHHHNNSNTHNNTTVNLDAPLLSHRSDHSETTRSSAILLNVRALQGKIRAIDEENEVLRTNATAWEREIARFKQSETEEYARVEQLGEARARDLENEINVLRAARDEVSSETEEMRRRISEAEAQARLVAAEIEAINQNAAQKEVKRRMLEQRSAELASRMRVENTHNENAVELLEKKLAAIDLRAAAAHAELEDVKLRFYEAERLADSAESGRKAIEDNLFKIMQMNEELLGKVQIQERISAEKPALIVKKVRRKIVPLVDTNLKRTTVSRTRATRTGGGYDIERDVTTTISTPYKVLTTTTTGVSDDSLDAAGANHRGKKKGLSKRKKKKTDKTSSRVIQSAPFNRETLQIVINSDSSASASSRSSSSSSSSSREVIIGNAVVKEVKHHHRHHHATKKSAKSGGTKKSKKSSKKGSMGSVQMDLAHLRRLADDVISDKNDLIAQYHELIKEYNSGSALGNDALEKKIEKLVLEMARKEEELSILQMYMTGGARPHTR